MSQTASKSSQQKSALLLTSLDDFKVNGNKNPPTASMVVTGLVILVGMVVVELTLRFFFQSIQGMHPILEDQTNRQILARHIGVDAGSCFMVAYLGYKGRHIVQDLIDRVKGANSMPKAYENRIFKYQPESARIALFFFFYQIKNLYDTIKWNDGPEFVVHHILTLATTWGSMAQGSAHFYVPFYLGVSEFSTCVLCLLANFDDVHGVKGLAEAFPFGKIVMGGFFAVTFIVCRVFLWSTFSYYYCRDVYTALKQKDPRLEGRKLWFQFTFVSLGVLSLLQIIWLAEIGRIGLEEMKALGLI